VLSGSAGGWFSGGFASGIGESTDVSRIDYSNDTATASIRAPLSFATYNHAAAGNDNFGWHAGGYQGQTAQVYSRVDRITYVTDTNTASSRGPLSVGHAGLAATGNTSNGWWAGGFGQGFPYLSTIDRITYSNDVIAAASRGPLSIAIGNLSATGNSNFGWFGGANNPSISIAWSSIVHRITYSNDAATADVRGPLPIVIRSSSAAGNSNYGWWGGGLSNSPGATTLMSTVSRIDYASDAVTASTRGPLASVRYVNAATGNIDFGWFAGRSTVDRIDYINETATATVRGSLSFIRTDGAASGGFPG
jgi:hypothetical protein